MWLWAAGPEPVDLDIAWRAYLRRFDIEHTFRFVKNTLGWTTRLSVAGPAVAACPVGGVVRQWRQRGGVQRDQPRSAVFASPDGEHSGGHVDVSTR